MKMEIKDIVCGYKDKKIVNGISITIESGEILCLLGPNGVGKTTLFKSLLGFLKIKSGKVMIDGEEISNWPRKKLAKAVGYVPQAHNSSFEFNVLDVVVMGRAAYIGAMSFPSKKDIEIAEESLKSLGITYLKDRIYTEISGGERQMVLLARALTQQPKILIMDEPTSNLDYGNQVRLLQQVNELARKGLAIIMTTHSPDHAFLCSSKVALLQRNNKFKVGTVDEIVTEKNLREAYGVNVSIVKTRGNDGEEISTCVPLLS
ncbi:MULTISPECIES: ABC transporter ATP-binding protein [unclassified Clostridium]|uniref:ABC transporter ATP-binding protein n=1 Tax=unclassified Clostridium TaxID=2614128 RepID=UPI000297E405|nr:MULTISPECIES: ABC transporter ATP-binding protein [unclassified Clostridium]EKQ52366.1 MAG: ABC-type cobalamin/Fe3+-siderophore transport system, ATPase component [Clostridium sp. Maddingley MBC34-26]